MVRVAAKLLRQRAAGEFIAVGTQTFGQRGTLVIKLREVLPVIVEFYLSAKLEAQHQYFITAQ